MGKLQAGDIECFFGSGDSSPGLIDLFASSSCTPQVQTGGSNFYPGPGLLAILAGGLIASPVVFEGLPAHPAFSDEGFVASKVRFTLSEANFGGFCGGTCQFQFCLGHGNFLGPAARFQFGDNGTGKRQLGLGCFDSEQLIAIVEPGYHLAGSNRLPFVKSAFGQMAGDFKAEAGLCDFNGAGDP